MLYFKERHISIPSKLLLLTMAFILTILNYYKLGTYTPENYMFILIAFLVFCHIAISHKHIFFPKFIAIYISLSLIYVLYSILISEYVYYSIGVSKLKIYLPVCVFVISTIQFRYALVRYFAFSILFIICVSALVGVGQSIGLDIFWEIRRLLPYQENVEWSIAAGKINGLALTNFHLAYQIIAVTPILYYIKNIKLKYSILVLFWAGILGTQMIAGLIAIMFFTIYLIYKDRTHLNLNKTFIKLISLFFAASFIFQLYTVEIQAKGSIYEDTRIMNLVFIKNNFLNLIFGNGYNLDINVSDFDMSFEYSSQIIGHFREERYTSFFIMGFYQAGLVFLILLSLLYWFGYKNRVLPYLLVFSTVYFFHSKNIFLLTPIPLLSIAFALLSESRRNVNEHITVQNKFV